MIFPRRFARVLFAVAAALAALSGGAPVHGEASAQRPDGGGAHPVTSRHFMVVAAHPLAVDAGYAVLRKGGTAVDAAIAVQLVLNLVEPQSSGIGGGAFMLVHDATAQAADRLRRPRDRAGGGAPGPLSRSRRQAARVLRRGRRRPLGRRAGRGRAARGGASPARQAAVGEPVRAGDRARGRRLPGLAAPARRAGARNAPRCSRARGPISTMPTAAPRAAGRLLANPAFAATLRTHRRRRRAGVLHRRHRARHRRHGRHERRSIRAT